MAMVAFLSASFDMEHTFLENVRWGPITWPYPSVDSRSGWFRVGIFWFARSGFHCHFRGWRYRSCRRCACSGGATGLPDHAAGSALRPGRIASEQRPVPAARFSPRTSAWIIQTRGQLRPDRWWTLPAIIQNEKAVTVNSFYHHLQEITIHPHQIPQEKPNV